MSFEPISAQEYESFESWFRCGVGDDVPDSLRFLSGDNSFSQISKPKPTGDGYPPNFQYRQCYESATIDPSSQFSYSTANLPNIEWWAEDKRHSLAYSCSLSQQSNICRGPQPAENTETVHTTTSLHSPENRSWDSFTLYTPSSKISPSPDPAFAQAALAFPPDKSSPSRISDTTSGTPPAPTSSQPIIFVPPILISRQQQHTCPSCGEVFDTPQTLARHIKSRHGFPCQFKGCGIILRTEGGRKRHHASSEQRHHSKETLRKNNHQRHLRSARARRQITARPIVNKLDWPKQ